MNQQKPNNNNNNHKNKLPEIVLVRLDKQEGTKVDQLLSTLGEINESLKKIADTLAGANTTVFNVPQGMWSKYVTPGKPEVVLCSTPANGEANGDSNGGQ